LAATDVVTSKLLVGQAASKMEVGLFTEAEALLMESLQKVSAFLHVDFNEAECTRSGNTCESAGLLHRR
jgi:hypothetical protein